MEEEKPTLKQSKKSSESKKEVLEQTEVLEQKEKKVLHEKKDEFSALRERLLNDYKGRLTAEQIEQRINIIKQSKENK